MPNDDAEQRTKRLRASNLHIENARKIAKESRRLRDASEKTMRERPPRRMP